jgi:arsenite methyltransferase
MKDAAADPHQADYGIDGDFNRLSARWQAVILAVILLLLLARAVGKIIAGQLVAGLATALLALWLTLLVALYLRTTRVGKFEVWARILSDARLSGDERVLDLGCGRGALLMSVARLLPQGRAVGIDLWRADQTGNHPGATLANAEREGVADRVELVTGDITQLPFPDGTFDLVLSSLALHNISSTTGRLAALDEAVRVLRPGGRLAIADLWATKHYQARLHELGLTQVHRRNLGWRMWWGGPWLSTTLVTATKKF